MRVHRAFMGGAVLAGVCVLLVVCTRGDDSPVVAQVGDAQLTLDDLYRNIPEEYRDRITREQNVEYVKQWIDTELLYREALNRSLHKEKDVRRRLERMRRDLLSAELLNRQQLTSEHIHISDTMVQEYYERNEETFVRPKEVVRFLQIVVDKYSVASSLRSQANAKNFSALAAKHSKTPAEDPRSAPYLPLDELEPRLAAALKNARPGNTRGPVKLDDGYYLLHLLDRQEAGTVATLDEVRGAIVDRLTSEIQKREVERVLSSLRMQTNVTLNIDVIPGAEEAPADTVIPTDEDL